MARESMSKRFYKDSPTMERDKEDGQMKAKKGPTEAEKQSARVQSGTDQMPVHEGMSPAIRHASERRDMHSRYEMEHHVHDMHTPGKPKDEMHSRHEKDLKDMHSRHEKDGGDAMPKKPEHKVER